MLVFDCCFFFSSRRRHTRWPRDWSSDVCSSDLGLRDGINVVIALTLYGIALLVRSVADEIGRASCRERVEISGVAVSVQKKRRGGERDVTGAQRVEAHAQIAEVTEKQEHTRTQT